MESAAVLLGDLADNGGGSRGAKAVIDIDYVRPPAQRAYYKAVVPSLTP